MSKQELSTIATPVALTLPKVLLEELRQVIDQTRWFIASTVNAALTTAFWKVGNRIRKETLQEERAGYGQEIVATLSRQLVVDYGNSFTDKNLRRMRTTCRMHGGHSRGPKTAAGKKCARLAALKHGGFTKEAITEYREVMQMIKTYKNTLWSILRS